MTGIEVIGIGNGTEIETVIATETGKDVEVRKGAEAGKKDETEVEIEIEARTGIAVKTGREVDPEINEKEANHLENTEEVSALVLSGSLLLVCDK